MNIIKEIIQFIYSKKDEGVYRKLTILGIKINTKPKKLRYNRDVNIIKSPNYIEKKYKLAIFLRFGIGDYILFRKFLPYIREYYKEYNITIIGNNIWQEILEYFDMDYIDEFISYGEYKYFSKEFDDFPSIFDNYNPKAFKYLLSNRQYDILISPFYGRQIYLDMVISYINAKEKIASYGSLWHSARYARVRNLGIYTKIIYNNDDNDDIFEIERNKNFFEQLLNTKININDISVKLDKDFFEKIDFNFEDKYILFFPFSAGKNRMYKLDYFKKIIEFVHSKSDIISYIVGSKEDKEYANEIINDSNLEYVKNICGKYKLNELFYIFNKAKLIITVDSAGYHIAVATNDNVICIASGMSYSRYLKYPKELVNGKNINIVLPKELEKDIKNNTAKIDYEYYPLYDLQSIEPDYICKLIDDKYKL